MHLPAGTTLERYVLGDVLGQGGFGITYLAEHARLHTRVVIKEFFPGQLVWRAADGCHVEARAEFTEEAGHFLQSFEKEAQLLATFSHHNIVRVTDVFEANDTAYIVMAHEQGQTLERLFRDGLMRDEGALRGLLGPLLDALDVLHGRGIIHRDIKGDNIIVREDGSPVLIDFGSARMAHGVATQTVTALVTPGYAPIEQFDADSSRLGPWTDIYALGATLYRAITERPPARAFERSSTIADQRPDPYHELSTQAYPDYSARFLAAVNEALAFSPQYRPQSTDAWRALLDDTAEGDAATRVAGLQRAARVGSSGAEAAGSGAADAGSATTRAAPRPAVAERTETDFVDPAAPTVAAGAAAPVAPPSGGGPAATPVSGGGRRAVVVGLFLLLGAAGVAALLWPDALDDATLPGTAQAPPPAGQVGGADVLPPPSGIPVTAPPARTALPPSALPEAPVAATPAPASPTPVPSTAAPSIPESSTATLPTAGSARGEAPLDAAIAEQAAEAEQLRALLVQWAQAWEDNVTSVERYADFYSEAFTARGMSRGEWIADKRDKGSRAGCIEVELDDVQLTVAADRAVLEFVQTYRSDSYCDVGPKTMELQRSGGQWRVVGEEQATFERCADLCQSPR